jgi:hypothetical protein
LEAKAEKISAVKCFDCPGSKRSTHVKPAEFSRVRLIMAQNKGDIYE